MGGSDEDVEDLEVQGINNKKRYLARNINGRKDEDITEKNLENIARAMSQGAGTV